MNASIRRLIAHGRKTHNEEHVHTGKAGRCCMYCLVIGLTEIPDLPPDTQPE